MHMQLSKIKSNSSLKMPRSSQQIFPDCREGALTPCVLLKRGNANCAKNMLHIASPENDND